MQTNKQLELAYKFIQFTGQNIFLTGKAGTGKTTFLKTLKQKSPKRMIVVAPTGVAAINAGGITIHSFFQLSFGPQIETKNDPHEQKRFSKTKINIIRTLDLLIIDEISMVRADVLDAIDRVLRRFRTQKKSFGGAQILMIGDLQQLSPIIKENEWNLLKTEYETGYFFSSRALRKTPYVSIELTHVFRQQDDRFISILNKVRENKLDEEAYTALMQRHFPDFIPEDNEGYITLCTHNAQAHRINDSKLNRISSKDLIFKATVEGNFPEYSYPTDFELKLKVGAQVMFVKNDPEPEKLYFNGKIGKITRIEDNNVHVLCPDEEDEIAVSALIWENIRYSIDKKTAEIKESVEGSFSQIPLKLAWAITIHKSQGLTFEKAIIDAEASFAHGQVYVALSRCKTLEGMVLSTPVSKHSIINDGTVNSFIRDVEQNQPGDKELTNAKVAYQKELLISLFSFETEKMLINTIYKIARENSSAVPETVARQLRQIKAEIYTDLVEVAEKFQKQVQQLLATQPNVEQNKKLQERISKAADYFGEKLNTVIINSFSNIDLEFDNRALRKQINNTTSRLLEESEIKLARLKTCKNGFSTKKLLDATAKGLLENSKPAKTKRKAKEIQLSDSIPHPELYNQLRSWRHEKSSELNIPAYMIFSQKALYELVNYLPTDLFSLQLINGLGKIKISQFGEDIIQIIQYYCRENKIDKGEISLKEAPVKEKKPKVDTKKVSFEIYQSGKSVSEIAKERSLTRNTIENHLAHYVGLGEIDIHEFVPKEKLDRIIAYFKSAENRNLSPAKAKLGDDFSYGELRLGVSYFEFLKDLGSNKL